MNRKEFLKTMGLFPFATVVLEGNIKRKKREGSVIAHDTWLGGTEWPGLQQMVLDSIHPL